MHKLVDAFNPQAAAGVMCRTTLSVGWEGRLYDCDFNQMLDLELAPGLPRHIRDFDAALAQRRIVTGQHCYGCTAGCGSGCQGGDRSGRPDIEDRPQPQRPLPKNPLHCWLTEGRRREKMASRHAARFFPQGGTLTMRPVLTAAAATLLTCLSGAAGEGADPSRTNYLVFPARKPADMTELQRSFARQGGAEPDYRVLINASPAVRPDGTIDPRAFDWESLEKEIHEHFRVRVGDRKYRIALTVVYYGSRPNEESRRLFSWALKGMAADFGYDEIDVAASFSTDADGWKNDIQRKQAYDLIGKGQQEEPALDHELVTVYPVRTPYSRQVLGGADCVVDIKRAFDKDDEGTLTRREAEAVAATVARLNLSSKDVLYFRIRKKFGATRAIRTFSDETGKDLAKKLGFKSHITQISEVN